MSERVLNGRFRLGSLIGEGGMGRVFAAEDLTTHQLVAVKMLEIGDSEEETRFRAFFTRERKAMVALQHRSLLQHIDHGEVDGRPYVVTELLDGEDLERVVFARGGLPDWVVSAVLDQALSALAAAHEQDIVHRDIKPSNVFLCRSGRVVLLDFGLARATSDASGETLARGLGTNVMGTPHYMAPEMLSGVGLSKRSDLYSLGATAFFLCSGKTPLEEANILDLLRALRDGKTRQLRSLRPDVDPRLDSVISRLMAFAPKERPAEAAQARRDVAAMLQLGEAGEVALAQFAEAAVAATRAALPAKGRARAKTPVVNDHATTRPKVLPVSENSGGLGTITQSPPMSGGRDAETFAGQTPHGAARERTLREQTVRRQADLPRKKLGVTVAALIASAAAVLGGVLVYSSFGPRPSGLNGTPPAPPKEVVVAEVPEPNGTALPPPAEVTAVDVPPEDPAMKALPPVEASSPVAKKQVALRPPGKGTLSLGLAQWAEVQIDGVGFGRKQFATNLELDEGTHEVVLRHSKYGERKHKVVIKRDGTTRLDNDFTK